MLFLGVPTFGKVSTKWVQNYLHLAKPLGYVAVDAFDDRKNVDIATKRNSLVQTAIQAGAEVLIFLGDDVIPPTNTIMLLLDWWRKGYKAVTGVYWTKTYPTQPYIFHDYMGGAFYDWKVGEFFPIAWAGCDCLMLDVQMLKEMNGDWFSLDYQMGRSDKSENKGVPFKSESHTEDIYFYTKLKERGIQLYCDSSIQCLHEDRNSGTTFGLNTSMPQYEGIPLAVEGKLIANIGCGKSQLALDQKNTIRRYDCDPQTKPDMVCDVRKIPEEDNVFDLAVAYHVLEHIEVKDAENAVREWLRILKPDGTLEIRVPNIEFACKRIASGDLGQPFGLSGTPYFMQMLYGQQTGKGQFHYNGFTKATLSELLIKVTDKFLVEEISPPPNNDGFTELRAIITKTELKEYHIYDRWPEHENGNSKLEKLPNISIENSNGHEAEALKTLAETITV